MDKYFYPRKDKKTSSEINNKCLESIGLSNVDCEPVRVTEDIQNDYEDPRWIEKSNYIKSRDNYTCQLCHTFNPMIGNFVFVKQGDYDTIHHYYWEGSYKYDIQVRGYFLVITFNFFAGYHLAMPRLNVHHKIYYRNRYFWDYPDYCLVTLCEDCHHYIHSLNNYGIPIVEENTDGRTMLVGKTQPKPYYPKLDHTDLGTFHPFALVKENLWGQGLNGQDLAKYQEAKKRNKPWYDYHEILDKNIVNIRYLTGDNEYMSKYTAEETNPVAEFIINDFIENILGFKKK